MQLQLEVLGEEIISRRLLRFAHRVQDARPAFRKIAVMLDQAKERQFATEGAYGGEKWAPLADSTLRSKPSGLPILVRTGALKGSFKARRVLPQVLEWGSDVPYGVYHMHGTSRMPARPPLKLPEGLKRSIVRELQRTIIEEMRSA